MNKIITLSILIPVFNEKKTIKEIIKRIKAVKLPFGIRKEIIVVDDNSTDGSYDIVKKISGKEKIKLFHHNKNLGKGAAIRTALKKADGNIFIIQDADLEYHPKDYLKLIQPILEKKADVVYGNRMRLTTPFKFYLSLLGNKLLTLSTNLLYRENLSDVFVGFKVFTKKAIEGITLTSNTFNIEIELTAKFLKKGLKIYEVPISYHGRSWDEGKKITFSDGLFALFDVFKYKFFPSK